MPRMTYWTALAAALCVSAVGVQRGLEVEQIEHGDGLLLEKQMKQEEHARGASGGCSAEMLWAASNFATALAEKRVDLLTEIFTDTGMVVTKDQAGSPKDVLGGLLESLLNLALEEEAVFCANGDKSKIPKLAVRYHYTFETADGTTTGTFLVQLLLEKVGHDVRIALAEIFSNSFAQLAMKDTHYMNGFGAQQELCPQEAIDLAIGYVAALGARDYRSLAKMFTSDGYALSTSKGRSDPEKFFREFLTSLEDARAVDTDLFCQLHSESPMVLIRFDISYKAKGDTSYHQGVYIDQFAFVREHKDAHLKLKFVHMFENPTVKPSHVKKNALYLYGKHGSTCSYEALELVRSYLAALQACDPTAATKAFAKKAVVSTPYGTADARNFYAKALAECSLGELVEEAAFCQESHAKAGPSISVRFHYGNMHKGERHSIDFFGQFSFERHGKDMPLQISKLDLFKNEFNQAKPHLKHSSYLGYADHKFQHEEHARTKFLLRPEDKAEGCSSEAHAVVDTYFHALGNKDMKALQKILAPGATVMSPHTGARSAVEFFASILPFFQKVSAIKEEQYCEMYEQFGTVATRSLLALDKKSGVIFTHFLFVRTGPHAPLQLRTVEIFDNMFVNPAARKNHHAHDDDNNDGNCPGEAYSLVDQYLIALATKNTKLIGHVFCEDGKVKSERIGMKTAKDFFGQFLPLLSDVKVARQSYTCDEHVHEPPAITVSFDFSYSLAGMISESKYINRFEFVRVDTYAPLRVEMVHMRQVHAEHGTVTK